jgi:Helix-turn-helix
VSDLSDLLNRHIPEGVTNRELERQCGGAISRSTINKYRNGTHGDPTEEVLRVFHEMLRIPMTELRAAADQSPGESGPWVPPVEADRMDGRQRKAVKELIRSFVATQGAGNALPADQASPSGTSDETQEGQEVRRYLVFRIDASNPNEISQQTIEAVDDYDARRQLHHALDLAGVTIDPRSDEFTTITHVGGATTLVGIARESLPDREEYVIERLRTRARQLAATHDDDSEFDELDVSLPAPEIHHVPETTTVLPNLDEDREDSPGLGGGPGARRDVEEDGPDAAAY